MSALDDITKALAGAAPVKRGRDRVILIGISARRALGAEFGHEGAIPDTIHGLLLRDTSEFDGWTIRDVDQRGRWHDVEVDQPQRGAAQ